MAQRAGVALSTVHRRWATKAALVADGIEHALDRPFDVADLGCVERELRATAEALIETLRGSVAAPLLRAFLQLPPEETAAVRGRHVARGAELLRPSLERAITRGQLPAGADPRRFTERLVAGIWFRVFVTGLPLDEAGIDAFVHDALAATRAAGPATPRIEGPAA